MWFVKIYTNFRLNDITLDTFIFVEWNTKHYCKYNSKDPYKGHQYRYDKLKGIVCIIT